ncbi:LytTR family DNA-binding domain-containing protein [Maribacter sp.]|nr:LytTR family DNA-binding domain-containing protein [Maribacter sp.]
MINCVIVEDELLAKQKLELYVKGHHDLTLAGSYVSAEDFLSQANDLNYELLLVDIGLPNIDGITLAHKISKNCRVIFTTANAEFAVEAFNLNAADYLLKPFDFKRFSLAIEKLGSLADKPGIPISADKKILIKEGKKIHSLSIADIFYIKGLKEYVVWHTAQGQLVTLHSLAHLSDYLKSFNFIQTHKSYIVNTQKVTIVEYGFIYLNKVQIPIGRNYRAQVKEKFRARL